MKLFIKHKNDVNWTDFTKYMNMPSFIMNLTTDGTFSSASFVLRTPKELGGMDLTKPIPPKMMVKITEVDEFEDETEFNTWHFYTTDSNNARVRKEVEDQVSSLYIQEVNCEDIISRLDNRYLPNYTITQPKTRFFSTFVKGGGAEFRLDQRFSQNGSQIKLAQGIKRELAKTNINGELTFNYDSVRQEHYLEFTELNEASLLINFQMEFAKSALTTGRFSHPRIPFLKVSRQIMPYRLTGGFIDRYESYSSSDIDFNFQFEYYDANDNLVRTKNNPFTVKYSSGQVPIENDRNMTALGLMHTNEQVFSLPREEEITKVRAYLKITNAREELMGRSSETGAVTPIKVETRIPGFNNDDYVKAYIDRIVIKANTGSYDKEVESYPTMLIDFIEKAIFDYNLNTREKVELSEDVKPLLSVVAKESEWGDFTLRELLERAFKYVGIIPILRPDNTISYSKTTKVSRYIDLEQKSDKQSEHINDNYYDKVVSTAKNLVSQEDFVREIMPLSSIETEFSNITTENAGFITSNDIYYLTNAILHTPGLEFDFGGGVKVNTNIGKPFYWDITERTFEEDIYNSFPNVRLDGFVEETEVSPRDYEGFLSKSNTIFYKSGSNYIGGLFNQGDYVPDYSPFGYIVSLFSPSDDAEYAVIEMLIVLAYSQLAEPIGVNLPNPNIFLIDIASYELDITYVPIYKELTTKYLSNMSNRQGLDWEKKLNLRDRVISYENNEEVLRNEMEKKGNVKELFTEKYRKASDSIPINSIVNDNLYITSKQISFNKNAVEVEYVLQENFILQNEDIRLPVEFERYSVPYEYVEREIMLENHLIFQKRLEEKYTNMRPSSGAEFINRTLLDINNSLDGTLYAKVDIDENLYLMRVSKLETRFTMILAGKFLDNYVAGIQRYSNEEEQRIYTIPLSYTDGNGKFNVLKNLEIGYNESVEDLRLGLAGGAPYNIKMFPAGEYEENEAELNIRLITEYRDLLYLKDAREKVSITHTSYLQNETDDLKFYRFKPITKLGVLLNDINLTDDLKLEQVDYLDYDENYTIELTEIFANSFKITITSENVDNFTNGIVFINEQDSKFTLVGIIKEPIIIGNQLEFYISTTDTGTLTPKMLYLSFTIELEKELNYIQSEIISIEREIDFTLKNYVGYQFYEKDFELGIVLLGEASYNLGEFIEVDKNITLGINEYIGYQFYNQDFDFDIVNIASTSYNLGEVVSVDKNLNIVLPNYIGLEFLDNDFTLDIYAALNVVATQSTVLEVNKSLELDMYNFVSGSHLNKNYAFELYGIAEIESVIGETVEIDRDIEATIGLGIEKEYEIVSSIGVETYLVADTEAYISNVLDIESDLGITMYYEAYIRQDEYADLGLDLGLDLVASYNLGEVVSVNENIGYNFLYNARALKHPDFNLSLIIENSVSYIESTNIDMIISLEPTLSYTDLKQYIAPPLAPYVSGEYYLDVSKHTFKTFVVNMDDDSVIIYTGINAPPSTNKGTFVPGEAETFTDIVSYVPPASSYVSAKAVKYGLESEVVIHWI